MSKSVKVWFPTFIGEFFTTTASMTGHEVGAYQLIIAHLWNAGGSIPADDKKLAKLVKASPRQWAEIKDTLWPLFEIKGGMLSHAPTTAEIEKAQALADKKRNAAAVRWSSESNAKGMQVHSGCNAGGMPRAGSGEGDGPIHGMSSIGETVSAREDSNPFRVIGGGK